MPGRPAIASNHPPARIGRSSPSCHSWRALEILDVAGWTALTLGIHAAILLAPLLGAGLYGQFGAAGLHDVRIYFDDASRALRGAVPYRDYPVEYPPLALLVFVIPRLATGRFGTYAFLFAAEMWLFDALAVCLVVRHTAARGGAREVPARLAWYTLFFAALYPVVGSRYDLAPAAVALAGALTWFGGRPVAGGLLTAAGTLLKVFPAAAAAPAVVREFAAARVTHVRGLATFAVAAVAGGAAWYALGGAGSLLYHVARGLQIETTWAGALMLADKVFGIGMAWRYSHTSVELVAPGAGFLAALAIPAQVAVLGAVVWRFARSDRRDPLRYAAAAVLALIVPGKVLSPQYLIWLVPFVPTLSGSAGRVARPLFVIACAMTALEYLATRHLAAFELWAILALNCRNALLVALLAVLLGRGRAGEPEPAGG
jgi:glycosyl transferase family 87